MDHLRMNIAIAAMQGLIANGCRNPEMVAEFALKHADAMILEYEAESVESNHSIKSELVKAIKEKHPDLSTSVIAPAEILIHQLKTGLPF